MADDGSPSERDVQQWITRREAATPLGTTAENVKQLQRRKKLHRRIDVDGRVLLRRADIEALAMSRGGRDVREALTLPVLGMVRRGLDRATIRADVLRAVDALIDDYYAGSPRIHAWDLEEVERQQQREHEEQMLEMERELQRRWRMMDGEAEPPAGAARFATCRR